MLTTPRARVNGPAFLVGWLLGLGIVGAVVLALAGPAGASQSGKPATWVSWVEIALGVLLLLVALRQFRGRPRDGEDAQMPKWMGAIDKFKPLTALGFAAVLAGANPKNLLLDEPHNAVIMPVPAPSRLPRRLGAGQSPR